jgi:hypothetical protein
MDGLWEFIRDNQWWITGAVLAVALLYGMVSGKRKRAAPWDALERDPERLAALEADPSRYRELLEDDSKRR